MKSSQSGESIISSTICQQSLVETTSFGEARKNLTRPVSSSTVGEQRMFGEVIATCLRTSKLSVWPNSDESKLNEEEQINCLYSKFQQIGCEVIGISPRDTSDGCFVVELADVMMAQKALNRADEIGNILKAKKFKHPTASNPCPFVVLSNTLQIRERRKLTSNKLYMKKKGDIVLVNRAKGRRMRICTQQNGSFTNNGWASMFTEQGIPLLMQLEEDLSNYSGQGEMDLKA